MKQLAVLLCFGTVIFNFGFSQATDLIISEYVEGSSNNKYIEIFNGTTNTINLTDYRLQNYSNGSATPTTSVTLTGTIAPNSTIVYSNSAAVVYAGATITNAVCNFNGDDAIALFKISTSTFVDIVGNIGCDPGTGWTSAPHSTLDKTLRRNANICAGIITDPSNAPCDFPTMSSEWAVLNLDDVSGLGSHTMTCVACVSSAAPTTNSTTLTTTTFCTSAQISFTAGNGTNRIAVVSTTNFADLPVNGQAYTANSVFGAGEAIGAGNFTVLNGSGSFLTITGLTAGTTYFIKIFEYNGTSPDCNEGYLTTSVLSGSFTTQSNCATPQVRSILADACSSQEGLDELVIIENGANPLNVNDISLAFPSGGTYCNTTCGANTLLNNPTYINQLNTLAGCTLFQYADPIPAGGIIVVFTGLTPSYTFDYSTQCPSSSTYYAVFCNNASTAGRFANTAAAGVFRTLSCTFAGVSESVSYEPNELFGDGSFIDFDNPGNPTYRQEANCIYPLGVELVNFVGAKNESSVLLSWSTLTEKESAAFNVMRIEQDGTEEKIATLFTQGNSEIKVDYSFEDLQPKTGVNYYQLHQIDRNGAIEKSDLIAVQFNSDNQIARYSEGFISFTQTLVEGDHLSLYSIDGKFISNLNIEEKTNSIPAFLSNGTWIVAITKRNGQEQLLKCVAVN